MNTGQYFKEPRKEVDKVYAKTEKPKIGVDIDEVVVEFFRRYLELFNERFEKNLSFNNITQYHIWDLTDVSKKDSLKLAEEFYNSKHFDNLNLVEGVKEALSKLNGNYEIHFITSRPESLKEKTKNFLNAFFKDFHFDLHFSGEVWGESRTKGEVCKNLGIKFMVEDNAEYAYDCAKKGIKTFLLDKPWNKDYVSHRNLIKIKNWSEILENLENGNFRIF